MKGLLLTLLTPTAFAQYQAPISPLDAPPAPIESFQVPNEQAAFGSYESYMDAMPLSPLESRTDAVALQTGSLGIEAQSRFPQASRGAVIARTVDGAVPLSRLESLAVPASRGADLGAAHSSFFDLQPYLPDMMHGLGAVEARETRGSDAVTPPVGPEAERLGRRHPRLVFIVDTFKGPVADSTVRLIDILQQKGVQIVFITSRPDRGADSVDEVLTKRLKGRRDHPLLVVSSAGAKIYKHASQAANPKPLIPNGEAFSEQEWELIDKAVLETASQKRLQGLRVPMRPEKDAFLYDADLPRKANADAFVARVNAKLRSSGLPYRAEAQEQGLVVRAYKPQMAMPRVVEALQGILHRNAFANPEEIQVFADSKKSGAILRAFPRNAYIHDTKDEAALNSALQAVLGTDSLQKVSVFRSKIRSFIEYLRRKEPRSDSGWGGGGWTGGGRDGKDHPQELKFYKGVIMHELMGRLYRDMRNGEFQLATLDQAISRLRSMWMNPRRHYVRLPAQLARTAGNEEWRKRHRKAFNSEMISGIAWLRNYYARKFPAYPDGLLEQVVEKTANLSSDGKSLISVELQSPYTGRKYLVHVRPDRAEIQRGMQGPELMASVYRFGKEKAGRYDETEAKLLAMAMLKGYTGKKGSEYILNGRPVKHVTVHFEYIMRTVPYTFEVDELPKYESELTSLIERMEADAVFQKQYEKEQEKEAPRKARKPAKKTAKPAKKASRRSR